MSPNSDPPDPTAVLGRRTLAWLFDVLLFAAGFLVPVAVFGQVFRGADIAGQPGGFRFESGDAALFMRSRVLVVPENKFWIAVGIAVGLFLISWVIAQGRRGITPGKALFRVRCVTRQRPAPGILKALLRTLSWVIDLIAIVLPIGFILATFTRGHRRVGDFVAGTFVVDRAYARRLAERGRAGPSDAAEPEPDATADGDRFPRLREIDQREAAAAARTAEPSTDPVWDDALDTYVRWEPKVARWIGWDEEEQRWRVVDRSESG